MSSPPSLFSPLLQNKISNSNQVSRALSDWLVAAPLTCRHWLMSFYWGSVRARKGLVGSTISLSLSTQRSLGQIPGIWCNLLYSDCLVWGEGRIQSNVPVRAHISKGHLKLGVMKLVLKENVIFSVSYLLIQRHGHNNICGFLKFSYSLMITLWRQQLSCNLQSANIKGFSSIFEARNGKR